MGQGEQSSSHGELLRRLGIHQTPRRLLIISVLQASETPLSIEDILARVHERTPGVSASTVYRTLTLLERAGVIWRVTLPSEGITVIRVFAMQQHRLCRAARANLHCRHTETTLFFHRCKIVPQTHQGVC